MPLFRDRVKDSATTTGTGDVTVSGTAPTGFQTIATAGYVAGDRVSYVIAHQSANEWETGYAPLTSTTVLSRSTGTVLSSSNAGALVNFSAGTKDVFIDAIAQAVNQRDTRGNVYAHVYRGAY